MKKVIFLGMLASLALGACNNDDLTSGSGAESQKVFDGEAAYIVVSINDVGTSLTRATGSGFAYGSENEYAVNDAHFYFYDDAGVIVTEGNQWDGTGTPSEGTPAGSIEFKSDIVLMLSGLTNKNYPAYIVTVLNKPYDFTPANTLAGLEAQLASEASVGIGALGNFAMSTSSYGTSGYYFATPVSDDNFTQEPVTYVDDVLSCIPVDIYVERLAAKVTVTTSLTGGVTDSEGVTRYPLTGVTFNEEENTPELYVSLDGWKLNATAKMSYMMKNIDASWTSTDLGFDWNDADNFRSYWGMSPNYNVLIDGGYPTTSGGNTDTDEAAEVTALNDYLTYTSLSTGVNAIGTGYEYCGENTNTTDIISSKNSSAITSVLIKATLWEYDEESGTYVTPTVVRFEGVLFSVPAYLAYALSHLNAAGGLNAYYYGTDSEGNDGYLQIDTNYVELADIVDGYVQVVLTDVAQEMTWYAATDYDADGTPITMEELTTEEVQDLLDVFNNYAYNEGNGGANGYADGQMYYNVPIEHLNDTYAADGTLAEGNYGVVRNHCYQLTITDLVNIGKGIFDPDEVIIPDKDYDTYYIGAQINILSWMLVSQDVAL